VILGDVLKESPNCVTWTNLRTGERVASVDAWLAENGKPRIMTLSFPRKQSKTPVCVHCDAHGRRCSGLAMCSFDDTSKPL
jgi:hypothetical protein